MSDEIIRELWKIKDEIARENGYDVKRLIAYLQAKKKSGDYRFVDLSASKESSE